jgi:hypothetical protein
VCYIVLGESVLAIGDGSSPMTDCNHEEADTRIVVHLLHALKHGATIIQIRTVDTDVITILIGKYHYLTTILPNIDIWVAFGMGRNFCFYHINKLCSSLGKPKCQALPVFHAYTGCDTVSAFNGKGKKSTWQAWSACPEVTDTFVYLAGNPFTELDSDSVHFRRLERYTVILYDKKSPLNSINDVRMSLFCHKNTTMEKLPPTQVTC